MFLVTGRWYQWLTHTNDGNQLAIWSVRFGRLPSLWRAIRIPNLMGCHDVGRPKNLYSMRYENERRWGRLIVKIGYQFGKVSQEKRFLTWEKNPEDVEWSGEKRTGLKQSGRSTRVFMNPSGHLWDNYVSNLFFCQCHLVSVSPVTQSSPECTTDPKIELPGRLNQLNIVSTVGIISNVSGETTYVWGGKLQIVREESHRNIGYGSRSVDLRPFTEIRVPENFSIILSPATKLPCSIVDLLQEQTVWIGRILSLIEPLMLSCILEVAMHTHTSMWDAALRAYSYQSLPFAYILFLGKADIPPIKVSTLVSECFILRCSRVYNL